jgi:hypothetical protein
VKIAVVMLSKNLFISFILPLALLCSHCVAQLQQISSVESVPKNLALGSVADNVFERVDGAAVSSSIEGETQAPPPKDENKRSKGAFSSLTLGFKADTLGAGVEIGTPLSRSFDIRAGFNIFTYGLPFNIDGVHYAGQLHFRSGQLNLDWFPTRRSFHISPGVVFFKNQLTALSSVSPGRHFELGSQGFTNSVDDPLNGTASVVFAREFAPSLMIGLNDVVRHTGGHLSIPFEFGAAYTGPAQINVTLNGTACADGGCFTFATNPDAQSSLKQEIHKLNEDLKRVPVYPIVSVGLDYRF